MSMPMMVGPRTRTRENALSKEKMLLKMLPIMAPLTMRTQGKKTGAYPSRRSSIRGRDSDSNSYN